MINLGKQIISILTAGLVIMVLSVLVVLIYQQGNNYMPLEYIEITVNHGDTLWTLAKSIAPNMDPRKVVWDIQEINGINNRIFPGQILQVPSYQVRI